MTELELLLDDIEKLRENLIKLINEKGDLQEPEIIVASQNLNEAISKYSKFISGKVK